MGQPAKSTVCLHSPSDFLTGCMGVLKSEQISLITPQLFSKEMLSWMGHRETWLVRYCCFCTVMVAVNNSCSFDLRQSQNGRVLWGIRQGRQLLNLLCPHHWWTKSPLDPFCILKVLSPGAVSVRVVWSFQDVPKWMFFPVFSTCSQLGSS